MRYRFIYIFLLLSGTSSVAYAHAHVESSSPVKNEILSSSPNEVKITFSEALRVDESYIKVFDSAKKQVSAVKPTISDDKITVTESLPELKAGKYTVKWKVVCLCNDHHATKGSYSFTVK